jgi:hypothetical protein
MDEETKARSEAARRRLHGCAKCGGTSLKRLDGSQCDGLPGIEYMVCDGCGYSRAITRRQKPERL